MFIPYNERLKNENCKVLNLTFTFGRDKFNKFQHARTYKVLMTNVLFPNIIIKGTF